MKQKTTTTLDNNTLAVVSILSNVDAGKLFKAIARYATEGIEETFPEGETHVLYVLFKKQIDSDNARFKQTCDTNSSNAKGGKVSGKTKRSKKVTDADRDEKEDAESDGDSADDTAGGSDENDGKPPEENERGVTEVSAEADDYHSAAVEDLATAETEANAEKQAVAETEASEDVTARAEHEADTETESGNGGSSGTGDRMDTNDADLSFSYLESLYPRKDATADYRNASESAWNMLSAEDKRKATAYVQSMSGDGTGGLNDMYLSRFLKVQPWQKA